MTQRRRKTVGVLSREYGRRVRQARDALGLEAKELAYRASLTPGGVARVEAGETSSAVNMLFRLAWVLDIPPACLLTGEGFEEGLRQALARGDVARRSRWVNAAGEFIANALSMDAPGNNDGTVSF